MTRHVPPPTEPHSDERNRMNAATASATGAGRRILIVNPLWPHSAHSTRAANVVIYQLVAELARRPGLKLGFLKLSTAADEKRSDAEDAGRRELAALGVEFLDPLVCPRLDAQRPSRL